MLVLLFLMVVLAQLSSAAAAATNPSISSRYVIPTIAVGAIAIYVGMFSNIQTQQEKENAPSNASYYMPPPTEEFQQKLIVITGGTSGLGLESAKRLAAAGATIVITSRTEQKGRDAVAQIKDHVAAAIQQQDQGNENSGISKQRQANIYSVVLELEDLDSVKTFPQRLLDVTPIDAARKINVLINNAGFLGFPERQLTKDGFERSFQSNYLGHFCLTAVLFDRLAPDARVVNVASKMYHLSFRGLPLDDLNGDLYYDRWNSYSLSKLANILFTKELQRRVKQAGLAIQSFSLHPGLVIGSDLGRHWLRADRLERIQNGRTFDTMYERFMFQTLPGILGATTVPQGASTQIYLASAPNEALKDFGGYYFIDQVPEKLIVAATNMDVAKQLWIASEEMTKTPFLHDHEWYYWT